MANYDFKEILAVDRKKYLGTNVNGIDVFVYRCILHKLDEGTRKSIISYKLIPGIDSYRKALFPFIPIFSTEKGDTDKITKGIFDDADRGDIRIGGSSERGIEHLRYQRWQIYLFAGDTTSKDCSLPGLWELIEIGTPEAEPISFAPYTPPPGYGP